MGTNSGVPFTRHGNNLDELQHLVEMGLSPQEAIRVATLDSARLLKLDDRIGSLDEGKNADLVIVDGDPMDDVAVLRAAGQNPPCRSQREDRARPRCEQVPGWRGIFSGMSQAVG